MLNYCHEWDKIFHSFSTGRSLARRKSDSMCVCLCVCPAIIVANGIHWHPLNLMYFIDMLIKYTKLAVQFFFKLESFFLNYCHEWNKIFYSFFTGGNWAHRKSDPMYVCLCVCPAIFDANGIHLIWCISSICW